MFIAKATFMMQLRCIMASN